MRSVKLCISDAQLNPVVYVPLFAKSYDERNSVPIAHYKIVKWVNSRRQHSLVSFLVTIMNIGLYKTLEIIGELYVTKLQCFRVRPRY
jgi:hypothetical protein